MTGFRSRRQLYERLRFDATRQRKHQMHGRTAAETIAGRPDSAAQRGNRICAPMQPNAVIGFARLGGKPFIEHAFEMLRSSLSATPPYTRVVLREPISGALARIGLGHKMPDCNENSRTLNYEARQRLSERVHIGALSQH
jgi:hypothetical protein